MLFHGRKNGYRCIFPLQYYLDMFYHNKTYFLGYIIFWFYSEMPSYSELCNYYNTAWNTDILFWIMFNSGVFSIIVLHIKNLKICRSIKLSILHKHIYTAFMYADFNAFWSLFSRIENRNNMVWNSKCWKKLTK